MAKCSSERDFVSKDYSSYRGAVADLPKMESKVRSAVPLPHPDLTLRVPELLSPAGDWDCARAAVDNGADAIYFGLERFNARMRARNFTDADLPKLMEFL